ncbi:MAG: hypothetical protein GX208_04710 [Firmicutes bacterium]|nr:hypothetical protein [Bacillota bacterium]
MTTEQRLAMIKEAMKVLANTDKIDQKFKQRGLNSLTQAYNRHTSQMKASKIFTNTKRFGH